MTVKISNLPAATSVGSGDVIPVVQSGTTKKIDLNSPWNINIDGGNIDGTPIGVSSASSGAFTTLTASDDVNFDSGTLFVDASADAVGIGTASPNNGFITGNKVEIDAGSLGTTATNLSSAILLDANDGNLTTLQTYNYRVSDGSGHATSEWRTQRIVDVTRMGYVGFGSDYTALGTSNTERIRIDSSGDVGIGNSANNNTRRLFFNTVSGGTSAVESVTSGLLDQALIFKTTYATEAERMRITGQGNVGIGVTNPSEKLSVAGNIATSTLFKTNRSNAAAATAGSSLELQIDGTTYAAIRQPAAETLAFYRGSGGTNETMRITSAGDVGIGRTDPNARLSVADTSGGNVAFFTDQSTTDLAINLTSGVTLLSPTTGTLALGTSSTERMRIDSSGRLLVGTTTHVGFQTSSTQTGNIIYGGGAIAVNSDNDASAVFNRLNTDGTIVSLRQAGVEEGTISVSGTLVSYNGGHLSRWSRLPSGEHDASIFKGTVMTNLDAMVEWEGEDNEQLNQMAISSVEGDPNVAGIFINWDIDDEYNDMNIGMTGDAIIRIGAGVTVQRGDLLMSAGDGTAKPQGDDVVKSKTIAKVTSTHITCTYDDGSYCVPCVLMAC